MMHIGQSVTAIRFQPDLAGWVIAALAVFCLAALAVAAWRRAPGVVLRGIGFGLLLAWLCGPVAIQETRQDLPDIGLLVLDNTASMQIADRAALRAEAQASIIARSGRLHDLEWRIVTVPESGHDGTRLFTAIDQALADIPRARLAGIVAITDGQVHDIPTTPPPAPLTVLLPARGEQTDRTLQVIEAPGYGIVGKSITIKFAVEDLGVANGAGPDNAEITIRHDGEAPRQEVVRVGQAQTLSVPITRPGPSVVELSVNALPGEVSTLNNRAVFQINGVRDRLRVLLVSGAPNQGERAWRRLLTSDPSVDLVHFTILRRPDAMDMTPQNELALIAFPTRELFQQKLRDFDLIILDRFENRGLLPPVYLQNIADFVHSGGALLLSVGPEYAGPDSLADSPLADVLPARPLEAGAVVDGEFKPQITALGTRHPVTADLPGWHKDAAPGWGPWYRHIQPMQPRGEIVMAAGDGAPLLVLNHVGQGRSALLLSDQIWLWARGHDGGGPQAELLRRVAHWLMKEPELEEEALTARLTGGTLTVGRRSLADDAAETVRVMSPDGQTTPLPLQRTGPGMASGTMQADQPGIWEVADDQHASYAAAMPSNPLEIADLRVTATRLAAIAAQSGGGTHFLLPGGIPPIRRVEPGDTTSSGDRIALRRNHDHIVTGLNHIPLLPAWIALPILLALAAAAWRREGR